MNQYLIAFSTDNESAFVLTYDFLNQERVRVSVY